MRKIVKFIDGLAEYSGIAAAWIFFAIGLFVTFEVFVRNDVVRNLLGTAPTVWVDEVSRILQIWGAFLASAYVLKHRQMITIDIVFRDPNSLMRKICDSLGLIMLFIFSGVAVWYGFQIWLKATLAGHTTDSFLGAPRWFTDASIWVGLGLLFLQGLAEFVKIWTVGIAANDDNPLAGNH